MTLRSKRRISISAAGDPLARRVILLLHPTPGAGPFDPAPDITSRWGVHLLTADRPGYGATPQLSDGESHTVQHRADDLADFLRQSKEIARTSGGMAFDSVGLVGWGTGGTLALSLAARHPQLVDRVAVVNTTSPTGFTLLPGPEVSVPYTRSSLFIDDNEPALAARAGLGHRIDRMLGEASLQGSAGVDGDRRMLADPSWAEQLDRITADVRLIYGDDDRTSSIADGHWYRRRIRRSRTVRVPGEGALTIAARWARILGHVAPDHGGLGGPASPG
ncbi:pimeloyl-ACP methyl ester carboxylesterase [Okibacterium sp. HSC-33S16]|uniref:alpha/beta fold hydrolase n=1 Tax=Okibacterium sp. HSC-33S16 TaxID=2910965 RepID=UPI0020A11FD2|nr:alpha/beta hydrolase [Okibacterium sp. HSC-33S16]MCP2032256.1 pimeloyl-ACP methyl ester carboxylesterase [Okibacterium sp. HSC-33S16]